MSRPTHNTPKGSKSPATAHLKQGNLFSFFKKKDPLLPPSSSSTSTSGGGGGKDATTAPKPPLDKKTVASPSPPVSTTTTSSTTSKTANTTATNTTTTRNILWKQVEVGDTLRIFWAQDRQYYAATVVQMRSDRGVASPPQFCVRYDDGESEWTDLSAEKFQILHKNKKPPTSTSASASTSASTNASKKRRIEEADSEEEEEFEFQDEESEFDAPEENDNDDDEEEEDFLMDEDEGDGDDSMVTDDDDDEKIKPPKRKRTKKVAAAALHVTEHRQPPPTQSHTPSRKALVPSSSASHQTAPVVAPTAQASSFKTPLRQFANTVSPSTASSLASSLSSRHITSTSTSLSSKKTIPGPPPGTPSVPAVGTHTSSPQKAIPFTKGAVNVQGAHLHNHLSFLQHPKDSQGRSPMDAHYDPRTLKVNALEWERYNGGKMTDAVQQWWDLKSQYFDTVLLFKTGECVS